MMARRILTCRIPHLLLVVISCALVRQVEPKKLSDEQKEQFFNELKSCAEVIGMPENEFEAIVTKHELPTSDKGKCFVNCLMERMEFMSDGALNTVAIQATLDEQIEDESKREAIKKAVEECSETVKADDKCEYAVAASECLMEKYKELGLSEDILGV